MTELVCGNYRLRLDRPLIMGIVNLTPDSFSGDGVSSNIESAVRHARQQLEAGADILDIGAESTRPGAMPVSLEKEMDRLVPVVARIQGWGVPISVDTYKPEVMKVALEAGAAIINDITGMRNPKSIEVVASSNCGVCIMHMNGDPRTMQQQPVYDDVVASVREFLMRQVEACQDAGVSRGRIVVDPGFGFGKNLEHNLSLFRALPDIKNDGYPVLVGVSRKSMLGAITGRPVAHRISASVAAAVLAAQRGAAIIRVHDVAETRDALAIWSAIENGEENV